MQKYIGLFYEILVSKFCIQNISMSQTNGTIRIGNFIVDKNQVLGKGATGYVYKGFNSQTYQPVAVKAIQMSQVNNQVTQYLLDGEKKAMSTIKSPFIVKTYDIIQERDYCYIVMELCSNGTLKDFIQNKVKLTSEQAIQLFKKIVAGYVAIVDSLFIHRDLKTANILLRSNGDPVIIDFGYCQMIMGKRPMIQYNVGSPSYMSPEAHSKSRYSQKSDIWSLGVILNQMLTGKTLDNGINIKEFFKIVESEGRVRLNKQGNSPVCNDLLDASLQVDPQKRATIHKLKYIIDKSLIPQMQAQLKKTQSDSAKNISQGELKFVPPAHFNFMPPKSSSSVSQKQKRQKINENLKFLRGSDQFVRGADHQFWSRDSDRFSSNNQNSFNSVQGKSQMFLQQQLVQQNIPPMSPSSSSQPHQHPLLRKSLQRSAMPDRMIKKIMSVKEVEPKPTFRKIPILQKATSINGPLGSGASLGGQEQGQGSGNIYSHRDAVSLRII